MSTSKANLNLVCLPAALIVENARRLARHGEYQFAEYLLRCVLDWDAGNSSARHWLEFALEAQGRFDEAYSVHTQLR